MKKGQKMVEGGVGGGGKGEEMHQIMNIVKRIGAFENLCPSPP